MRRLALLVVLLAACEDKRAPPPRPELIDVLRDFADRTCECGTDKECVKAIREEWEPQKKDLQKHGLTGDPKADYDAELQRFRACGDAAGVTIWL